MPIRSRSAAPAPSPKLMPRITQKHIAQQLGLSHSAVKGALNPDPRVRLRPETRQRVLRLAQRLGYRPHRQAQILRGKKSGLVGIIKGISLVQAGVEKAFYVARAIQRSGYGLTVNELHWDELGLRRAVDAMLDAQVEGVLLNAPWTEKADALEIQRLRDQGIPVIALGVAGSADVPAVQVDYRQGMRDLTRHLLARGFRRLNLICPVAPEALDRSSNITFSERARGFLEAAADARLPSSQARILHLAKSPDWRDSYVLGRMAIQKIEAEGVRPEALLCSNDESAVGALLACAEAGWRVPDDLAVTGFDNSTISRYMRPALTTVAQPSEAVAEKAVELLLKRIRGQRLVKNELSMKFPCRLVIRESCGQTRRDDPDQTNPKTISTPAPPRSAAEPPRPAEGSPHPPPRTPASARD